MGNKQYAAQQLAERFVDQREIQNVMGKYMFTTMICKDADVAARFWSKKAPEPALGLNDGWYVGLDAIDGYYRAISVTPQSGLRPSRPAFRKSWEARRTRSSTAPEP